MSAEFLDRYSRAGSSPLHRQSARVKLLATLAIVLTLAFVPAGPPLAGFIPIGWFHVAAAAALLSGFIVAKIPLGYLATRLMVVVPLVLFLALSIPLSRGLGDGWQAMINAASRALLCFATVLLLVNTTPFEEILSAMARLGAPRLLVATLGFMYRYVFVLTDELTRMRRARQARSFASGRTSAWRSTATLVGMLAARSFERSERVYCAMLARGFDGTVRSLDDARLSGRDLSDKVPHPHRTDGE